MSLNAHQERAVLHDGPVLLTAPPGSGKTRVIVARIGRLLTSQRQTTAIAVCFARDAANELAERLEAEHGPELARRVQTGTFHSLAKLQLERAGREVNLVDEHERFHWIAGLAKRFLPALDADEAVQVLEAAKLDRAEGSTKTEGAAMALLKAYEERLHRASLMDFQDLLEQANLGMASGKVQPFAAAYLAIDETQDMNPTQLQWVEFQIRSGAELFAVGDDDQAIFSFCRAMGLRGMRALAATAGAATLALTANYRSRAEILQQATVLIAKNTYREPKTIHALRGEGGGIAFCRYANAEDQAGDVTSHVGNPLIEGTWGILARNRRLLFEVQAYLTAADIPSRILGQSVWRERPVRMFLVLLGLAAGLKVRATSRDAFLGWLDVPEGEIRGLHRGKVERWGFPQGLARFSTAAPARPLAEATLRMPIWNSMAADPERADLALEAMGEWLEQALTRLDTPPGRRRRDLILLGVVRSALRRMKGSVSARLLAIKRLETTEQPMRVILSTFHGAKGLEWDNVWLVSADASVIPHENAPTDEERRLFYVAMTRARERLFISTRRGVSSEFVYEAFPGYEKAIMAGGFGIGRPIHLGLQSRPA